MGWKSFRDFFNLSKNLSFCYQDDKLVVSNGYIDLFSVNRISGEVRLNSLVSERDEPYKNIMETPNLIDILNQEDVFEKSIPVYCFDRNTNTVVEDACEEYRRNGNTNKGASLEDYHLSIEDCLKATGIRLNSYHKYTTERLERLKADIVQTEQEKASIEVSLEALKKISKGNICLKR